MRTPIPGDRRQAPSGGIVAGQFDELPIQSLDTAVEIKPFLPHLRKQTADAAGHEVQIGEQCLYSLLELAASLCDSRAALQQNGAQLVGQRRTRAPPALNEPDVATGYPTAQPSSARQIA